MNLRIGRSIGNHIEGAKAIAKMLGGLKSKHWFVSGDNSVAMAVKLLQDGDIIAVPTDTIYGLAGLATNPASSAKLYKIKERSHLKPFAVCLSSVNQINEWAVIDNIPEGMLDLMLPGSVTVVLPRRPGLHEHINPGVPNVGIRVPKSKFILKVSDVAGPLVLTSANISNQPSCVKPEEFCDLWPQLGGIFHVETPNSITIKPNRVKLGSTIVDLSIPDEYHILRYGKGSNYIIRTLRRFQLKPRAASTKQMDNDADTLKDKQIC